MTLFLITGSFYSWFNLSFVTFCLKFTIWSNSHKFPTEFQGNSEIPGNSQREFRVAWISGIPGISRMGIPGGSGHNVLTHQIECLIVSNALERSRNTQIVISRWLYGFRYLIYIGLFRPITSKSVVHNVRPAGHIRPAKSPRVARGVQQEKWLV